MGGLDVRNPISTATAYRNSRGATHLLVEAIKGRDEFVSETHNEIVQSYEIDNNNVRLERTKVLNQLDETHRRLILRVKDSLSSWLTAKAIEKNHFNLPACEFKDRLALHYRRPLLQLPSICDRCGAQLSLSHTLGFRKGGLVL